MIAALAAMVLTQGVVAVEVGKGPVTALAFGPSGEVYAGGEAVVVRISKGGAIDKRFEGVSGKVSGICVSPDGELVLYAGGRAQQDGFARIVGRGGQTSIRSEAGNFTAIAHQSPPEAIWLAHPDGSIRRKQIFDDDRIILEAPLTGHSGPVYALAALPGGALLSGGQDGTLRVWSGEPPKLLRSLAFHTGPIHAIAVPGIVQGPAWCATASEDRTIRIWQPEIGRMVRIIRGAEGPLLALAITPDGIHVISGGSEGIVRMQPADGGEPIATWTVLGEWIHSIAISLDGKRLAFGASDGLVRLVNLPD